MTGSVEKLAARVEKDPAVVYVLAADLTIRWCNEAWELFARENGAPGLTREVVRGTPILQVTPPALAPFYKNLYEAVRVHNREAGHIFECSSPEQLRRFYMRIQPIDSEYIIVSNSLVFEQPHSDPVFRAEEFYRNDLGVVRMCAHCRRTKSPKEDRWDWVPALVRGSQSQISHGLCPFCRVYHYPNIGDRPHKPPDEIPTDELS